MRTALKAQDANVTRSHVHNKSTNPVSPVKRVTGSLGPAVVPFPSANNAVANNASASNNATTNNQGTLTTINNANVANAAYPDDDRDPLKAWRARWRQIMQSAIIYFDDIPQPQVERMKGYLALLNSGTQAFFDQKVTHVISENQSSELASKARDHGCKVYTVQKLSRFLGSLLGRSLSTAIDEGQPSRLAQLLEDDSRMSATHTRRDDFVPFRGPYLLIYDSQGYNRPLILKEWRTPQDIDDSEWPQLRRAPIGVSPFTSKSAMKGDKRKYHDQQVQQQTQPQIQQPDMTVTASAPTAVATKPAPNLTATTREEPPMLPPPHVTNFSRSINAAVPPLATVEEGEAHAGMDLVHKKRAVSVFTNEESNKENKIPADAPQNGSQPHPAVSNIPAQSTNSTRLREFGEIVASGVPRYSQTSMKSFPARDTVNSRELANLRRRVTSTQVTSGRNTPAVDPAVAAKNQNRPQAKTKPLHKKPGYCENCLERYNDLQEHLLSKTHQQFAGNESKFVGLDRIIGRLQRPVPNLLNEESPKSLV